MADELLVPGIVRPVHLRLEHEPAHTRSHLPGPVRERMRHVAGNLRSRDPARGRVRPPRTPVPRRADSRIPKSKLASALAYLTLGSSKMWSESRPSSPPFAMSGTIPPCSSTPSTTTFPGEVAERREKWPFNCVTASTSAPSDWYAGRLRGDGPLAGDVHRVLSRPAERRFLRVDGIVGTPRCATSAHRTRDRTDAAAHGSGHGSRRSSTRPRSR